ncbi:MAG: hypothetical protein U1D99_02050, partial [Candidatus Omnitrophota bacterium]|nr:hypothetical protein [Candidatus Omnitrophota bacterium]
MVILLMVALSSYFCAGVFWPLRLSEKFVYAISIFIIQILFVILSAGHLGFLNRPAVLAAWGVLSAAVFLYAQHKQPVIQQMAVDRDRLMSGTRKIFREPNGSFFAFSIFLFGWLLASAYFFPPRAVDDIDYHLPMVWEHWFKGQITLVPPPIQPEFAFPQNADLFFLMPVILWGTTRWIDAVQLIFSVCGSVVLFALLRSWGVTLSRSFFIGLMFFWAPVIIFQNGSCNHDVIFCVTALIILYL